MITQGDENMKEEINMKDKIVKLSNGVKVINTSPHPFTFEDGTVKAAMR